MVRTYVVPFARKELAVFSVLGIVTTFRLKAKEAHAGIVDGAMPTPSCVPKGKAGERGEGLFGVGQGRRRKRGEHGLVGA